MVEAGHETHVAVAVVHYHEGGISDVERCLVIARSRLFGTEVLQGHQARRACPCARSESRRRGVGREVPGLIIYTLYLHVVGVEAVAPVFVIGKFRCILAFCSVLCAALSCVAVTHFMVYVEVRPQIPLYVFLYVVHAGRSLTLHNV